MRRKLRLAENDLVAEEDIRPNTPTGITGSGADGTGSIISLDREAG